MPGHHEHGLKTQALFSPGLSASVSDAAVAQHVQKLPAGPKLGPSIRNNQKHVPTQVCMCDRAEKATGAMDFGVSAECHGLLTTG